MKKFLIAFLLLPATIVFAQSEDEMAIQKTLEDYMSGEVERATKAFHTSASMKFINYQTNEFTEVPIADYLSRMANNKSSTSQQWQRKITSIDIEGTAAQAKIISDTGSTILYDYMSLLKINGEWKIVSKVFSRKQK